MKIFNLLSISLLLLLFSPFLFSQKIDSLIIKGKNKSRDKVDGQVLSKTLDFNYNNVPDELKGIFKEQNNAAAKAIKFQLEGYWLERVSESTFDLDSSVISIELRDLSIVKSPTYRSIPLDKFLIPTSHEINLKVVGRDTNLVLRFIIDGKNGKASNVISIPKSSIIKTSLKSVELKYNKKTASNLQSYLLKINEFNKCYDGLSQDLKELNKINLSTQTKLENLLTIKKRLRDLYHCSKNNCTKNVPAEILESREIVSLNSKVQSVYQKQTDDINRFTKDIDQRFYKRGKEHFTQNRNREAKADIEQTLDLNKKHIQALALRSRLSLRKGEIRKAEDDFKSAYNYLSNDFSSRNEKSVIVASSAILDYYLNEGQYDLDENHYDQAEKHFKQARNWCDKYYKLIDCDKNYLNQKVLSVRNDQLNDQLNKVERLMLTQNYQSAMTELDIAFKIANNYYGLDLFRLKALQSDVFRGRWQQLKLVAEAQINNAINSSHGDYNFQLKNYEKAYQALGNVNTFRSKYSSLLSDTYQLSKDILNESQHFFHLEYANKYSEEGHIEKSIEQFELSNSYTRFPSTEFVNSYTKFFSGYHKSIVQVIKDLIGLGISKKEEKQFESAEEKFTEAESQIQTLEDFEKTWLLNKAIDMEDSPKELVEYVKTEQLSLAEEAVKVYISQENFEKAQYYNKYLIEKGGKSQKKKIHQEELLSLESKAVVEKTKGEYLNALTLYSKALKIYDKYQLTEVNRISLRNQLLDVAKLFAVDYFPTKISKSGEKLSSIEKVSNEFSNWIKDYEIPLESNYIIDIKSVLDLSFDKAVKNKNEKIRGEFELAINNKDYIRAHEILTNNHSFLESYNNKFGMDFSDLNSQSEEIFECCNFQKTLKASLLNIENNSIKKLSDLYELEQIYIENFGVNSRIDKPMFIPIFDFVQSKSPDVLLAGVEVHSNYVAHESAYKLLIQYLGLSRSNVEATKHLQKKIATALAQSDNSSKRFNKKKEGLGNRIPKRFKKQMKTFKKAYKKAW